MLRFASIKKKRTRIFHFSRTREMLLEPQLHWEPDALLFISHASARCYLAFRQKCRKSCGFHFSRQREMLPGCNPLTAVSRTLSFLTHARDVTKYIVIKVPAHPTFISHARARCYWATTARETKCLSFISHARARCYRNIEQPCSI